MEGLRDNPFGRRFLRGRSADVGMEIGPSHTPEIDSQVLEQSLGDEPQLNVPLVGTQLATDVRSVSLGFALQVLLAAAAMNRSHVLHPEVIGISPDGVDGLLETHLNFEAPAIQADNLQRVEGD